MFKYLTFDRSQTFVCGFLLAAFLTASANAEERNESAEGNASADQLPRIYVEGDRTPNDPGAVSYLSATAIEQLAADHPAEVLNTLPGVNVQMNSGQEHLVAIRSPVLTGGTGQGSFLILENGLATRSPAFGNVNLLLEPHHEIAELIEVVRGPGSAAYGSNAVHGLINVGLPDPTDEYSADLSASYSTLNRYRLDGVLTSPLGETTSSSFGISLQDEVGWRDNTGLQQQKLSGSLSFTSGEWLITPWFSASNLNQETAGFIQGFKSYRNEDAATSNPNPEAFRDASSARAAIHIERTLGATAITVTPFARTQDMRFRQHFLPYRGFEENSHSAFGIVADIETTRGSIIWRGGILADFASGDLLETQPAPFGFFPGDSRFPVGVHYDYTVDTDVFGLWGEVELAVSKKLKIVAGLRGETHGYDYTTRAPVGINGRFNVVADRTDDFDLLTPKLGLIWDDAFGTSAAFYANLARGERAPQASDLYRLQSQQIAGQIKTETLDSFEIGIRDDIGRFAYDIAAYTMKKDNFFFRDAQGLNVPDGETEHLGIEAAASAELSDTLTLSGNVSWSEQTYAFNRAANGIVNGNRIDTAPEWLGDVRLEWSPSDNLRASASAEYVGSYFTNEANSAEYPGHTIAHARLDYTLPNDVEMYLIVRNLFDVNYADRADFAFGNHRYFPGEPMNATLGLRKKW